MTRVLLLAVIVAQLLDVATWMAMPRAAEANPLARDMHTPTAWLLKAALVVLVVAIQPALRERYRSVGELVAVVAIAAGCIGAGSNLAVLAVVRAAEAPRPATQPAPIVLVTTGIEQGATNPAAEPRTPAPLDPVVAQRQSAAVPWARAEVPGSNPGYGANGGDRQPEPAAMSGSKEQSGASPASTHDARHLAGRASWVRATWYCNADASRARLSPCTAGHPDRPGKDDLYAAVPKRLGYLRGSLVTVCAYGCVTVRVIDCNCQGGSIDLYADAFEAIAPLSAGGIRARVSVGAPQATPPATDR